MASQEIKSIILIGLLLGTSVTATRAVGQHCPGEPSSIPNPTIEELIRDFSSDQWPHVWAAKLRLESRQASAIPALLKLVESRQYVKLQNTWDLIYPGAEKFYGHGFIVDYDLDWLSARAGWALEEITFQQFGFEADVIKPDDLLRATIAGKADHPLKDAVDLTSNDAAEAETARKQAADAALQWWRRAGTRWTRLGGVAEALKSGNELRAIRAMEWIENGATRCDGFNQNSMRHLILPAALKLSRSKNQTLREQVGLLGEESKRAWLYENKNEKSCF